MCSTIDGIFNLQSGAPWQPSVDYSSSTYMDQITVVDKQSPQIGYLGGKLMDRQDFFRIELQISKDVEKYISEVFPASD